MWDKLIKACENHEFVGIVCEDGHEHTVKAFGNICGTPWGDKLIDQLDYCAVISLECDYDVLVADSVEEAVENDILDDNGESEAPLHMRYCVK